MTTSIHVRTRIYRIHLTHTVWVCTLTIEVFCHIYPISLSRARCLPFLSFRLRSQQLRKSQSQLCLPWTSRTAYTWCGALWRVLWFLCVALWCLNYVCCECLFNIVFFFRWLAGTSQSRRWRTLLCLCIIHMLMHAAWHGMNDAQICHNSRPRSLLFACGPCMVTSLSFDAFNIL